MNNFRWKNDPHLNPPPFRAVSYTHLVINMAHGEMVMLGAYTTFVVQEIIRQKYPGLFDYSLAIALPLAFIVAGAVGILIERTVIRFLYGRPLETLLATWGISLVLQQAVRGRDVYKRQGRNYTGLPARG